MDKKFLDYNGGIMSESDTGIDINHEISVVGYGKDIKTGQEFWVGRNSWGTYWGEQGFFRVEMHKNNFRIEEACVWAEPDLE